MILPFITAAPRDVFDTVPPVLGAIRVAGDLERVGDLAKNIAKRSTLSTRLSASPEAALNDRLQASYALPRQPPAGASAKSPRSAIRPRQPIRGVSQRNIPN